MALDLAVNFAKSALASGITSGAGSLTLVTGGGAKFAVVPWNGVIYNSTDYSDPSDDPAVEIVRCTVISTDTLTITRGQESTTGVAHNTAGKTYTLVAGPTAKLLTDILGISITGSAASAATSAITDDTTTATTMYPVWVTANTGNLADKVSSTKLSFNPSTGALSATIHAVPTGGAFTYNAVNAIVAQTALYNWFVGDSGNLTATGDHNLGFGHLALNALTSGTNNQAIGPSALLLNQSGGGNTAVGISALSAIVSSNNSTAIGYSACGGTGTNNVGIGAYALTAAGAGHENTGVGSGALAASTSAVGNTAVGFSAGNAITTGGGNTLIGYTAGYVGTNVVTSTNCTFIGNLAQQSADGITNSTALGYGAVVTASNQVVIGNTSVTAVKINGTATAAGLTVTAAPTFSAMTPGSVLFAGTAGLLSQDNAKLFWDDTNTRLGIGTAAPTQTLDVNGKIGVRESSVTLVNGANQNVSVAGLTSWIKIVGPTGAFSIGGIAGGVEGQIITFWNGTFQAMTVNYNDPGSSGGNKIIFSPNSNKVFGGSLGGAFTVQYDSISITWIMT